MKKYLKIIIAVIIALIVCWGVIAFVDYNRVCSLKAPIFVILKYEETGLIEYQGIGYKVTVKTTYVTGETEEQIQETEMYMFGKVIAGAIADIADTNNTQNTNITDDEKIANQDTTDYPYFYGTIVESQISYIIVEPDDGEDIRRSADEISIGLDEDNDTRYYVGTRVKITYTGEIMESYPAQVSAINIEIKSIDDFELVVTNGLIETTEDKSYMILSKDEVDSQDYDVYCYDASVSVIIDGEQMTLRDAVLNREITIDDIIARANYDLANETITGDMFKDGGSMIYYYDNYIILKCHTVNGNRDVYFGSMNFNFGYVE